MHLNQLWVFYHVAKHKSFSQAAEALCLSQPSVSNQVKLLENSYGLKLFERFGSRLAPGTKALPGKRKPRSSAPD